MTEAFCKMNVFCVSGTQTAEGEVFRCRDRAGDMKGAAAGREEGKR